MGICVQGQLRSEYDVLEILDNVSKSLRKFTHIEAAAIVYAEIRTARFDIKVVDRNSAKNYHEMKIIERRSVHVFFRDGKITFDLGAGGMAEEIILHIAAGLQKFGPVYYTPNDCYVDPYLLEMAVA